jgi:hypothetical protein
MGAIRRWFDRRRRRMDVEILWRICRENAPDLDHAKAAFFMHVMNDPAWSEYFTEAELCQFVSDL